MGHAEVKFATDKPYVLQVRVPWLLLRGRCCPTKHTSPHTHTQTHTAPALGKDTGAAKPPASLQPAHAATHQHARTRARAGVALPGRRADAVQQRAADVVR
jgi:hypothetical protein